MNGPRVPGAAALALCLAACGGSAPDRPAEGLDLASQPLSDYSLLRLPRGGGEAGLHAVPGLGRRTWRSRSRLPRLTGTAGVDLDQHVAFALASDGGVIALDFETGTVRTLVPGARRAVLGADRTLWAVDADGEVSAVTRRVVRAVPGRAPAPGVLFGTAAGQLVAVGERTAPRAILLGAGEEGTTADLPAGPVAATDLGDVLAVAADTALVFWHPLRGEVRSLRFRLGAADVEFSPAGHRAYVLTDGPRLDIVEPESGEVVGSVELPGAGGALRTDPLGAWLLVRSAAGGEIWVVDPVAREVAGTFRADWDADLPAIVGARVVIARQGGDIVALSLDDAALPEVGRVKGGAADYWLPLAWAPRATRRADDEPPVAERREAAEAADPDAEVAPPPGRNLYLQLSSSQNPAWAADLAQQLRRAGVDASVLAADSVGGPHRVVTGPYATREEAEEVARGLGRPSFIIRPGAAGPDQEAAP